MPHPVASSTACCWSHVDAPGDGAKTLVTAQEYRWADNIYDESDFSQLGIGTYMTTD